MPARDNKPCNHLSLLHRPGNYLPIPDCQNSKGKLHLPSPCKTPRCSLVEKSSTDVNERIGKQNPGLGEIRSGKSYIFLFQKETLHEGYAFALWRLFVMVGLTRGGVGPSHLCLIK